VLRALRAEGTSDMAARELERATDGKFHHGCGESFTHAAWYTKHALKCSGKPVQKRGRIERLAARGSRALVPARTAPQHRPGPGPQPAPRQPAHAPIAPIGAIAAAATDKAMEITIAGLVARRAQLDAAIAALEALRT
jgi:hypothetical protein